MDISEIKIPQLFIQSPPNPDKVNKKIDYYKRNGRFQKPIFINHNNVMYDGYATYMACKQLNITNVLVNQRVTNNKLTNKQIIKPKSLPMKFLTKLKFYMAKKLNLLNYIVLDCEFNVNLKFGYLHNEIIQIGLIKLNSKLKPIDTLDLYLRPKKNITQGNKTTGCRKDIIRKCHSSTLRFPDAIKMINNWIDKHKINVLCLWSDSDVKFINDNIFYYKTDKIDIPIYIDVSEMFNKIALKRVIEICNIDRDKCFHNALNDADYTARIFKYQVNKTNNYNFKYYAV
jgi:inhibitor of KinA sporulation pathway (predicted exonuclease)